MQKPARQSSPVALRLTDMITGINTFRIELDRSGKSTGDIRQFLNGLHADFAMLAIQLREDRANAMRAKTIGEGVTLLEAQLDAKRLCDIERDMSEAQTELMLLQMSVAANERRRAGVPESRSSFAHE